MNAHAQWTTAIALLVAATACIAQDAPPPPPPGPPALEGTAAAPGDVQQDRRRRPRGPGMQRPQSLVRAFLNRLKEEDPEEFRRLSRLHREDRQQFMDEMRKTMQDRGLHGGMGPMGVGERPDDELQREAERHCQQLSRQYREAETKEEKARLKAELDEAVNRAFEIRLEHSKRRIEQLERQLERFKNRIESLEENRERICNDRLEQLTRFPQPPREGEW